ncbi:hypothetical protein PtrV1_03932 [Pyrenophora tritici-repentis]|nr:hypothetical protein PtrV1_03932 [Pyrenophora tritici-repentis]KAF7451616.1 hypothetical protein A1F99_033930 [Pyrenophora tritici-repentis]KAI0587985.1 hypothetical protein Alg215_01097 [Pyrenophora tritici-repentis]KAI0612882.1 hypothetical protein TUN205_02894 [Pyrenophora tritici-repentis]
MSTHRFWATTYTSKLNFLLSALAETLMISTCDADHGFAWTLHLSATAVVTLRMEGWS